MYCIFHDKYDILIKLVNYHISTKDFVHMYVKIFKRAIDVILSVIGLLILSWLFLILIIAIKLESPGPVFFTQKRIGINKSHFMIHKFRTMRIDTPSDTPTHLLDNPEIYITKIGKIMRKLSLDELPQLYDILVGNMSIIGPRPALWNQFDLIEERDKYGANDVLPGLTGWAQINGRDELEISYKAKLDGDYTKELLAGGWRAFSMDIKCFFGTIISVIRSDGYVEGSACQVEQDKQLQEDKIA